MKHVVITKTHGEHRTKEHAHLPHHWPKECEEFDSLEAAQAAHPDKTVMTHDQYLHFSKGLALAHHLVKQKKPWWKFWGKK